MALARGPQEYVAIIGGRRRAVRIIPEGDRLRVVVDGRELLVGSAAHANGELNLLLDGRPRTVHVHPEETGRYRIMLGGGEIAVEITDPLLERLHRSTQPASRQGRHEIRSPMPGTVVDVRVSAGETVEPDTPLIVLEAMKMQNALASPVRGLVREVCVEPGQTVEGEALLLVLERRDGA